jgi:CRISPR-associated protein Cmr3
MKHALFLEPVDAWSFRDGKPFEVGEAFEARSLFPPHPRTVLGCLRTAMLRRLCPDPERYAGRVSSGTCRSCGTGACAALPRVGGPGEAPPFQIGPPLLAQRDGGRVDVYYPTPRDLVSMGPSDGLDCGGERKKTRTMLLAPVDPPRQATHCLGRLRPSGIATAERMKGLEGEFIGTAALEACLAGTPPALEDDAPAVCREPRIGIGVDPGTRGAREGHLYLRDVIRLEEGAGLLVAASEDLGLDGDIARLGGDGRMTRIIGVEPPHWPRQPDLDRRLKVYFVAPTWFRSAEGPDRSNWYPSWLDADRFEGILPGIGARLRLVGAAVGPLAPVGGWNLASQQPRPIHWLVPAGAVYFFDAEDAGQARAAADVMHGRSLCDDDAMAHAGFGLAFVGRW